MDDVASRTAKPERRMASWRPSSPPARATASARARQPRAQAEPEVPRSRWAGVGLVVFALLAAIVLAATAPLEPDEAAGVTVVQPSPSATVPAKPTPSLGTGPVPEVAPSILDPGVALTAESTLDLTVSLPETPIRPRDLKVAVFRNDREVARLPGRGPEVSVDDVELKRGENVLTAALVGPGGIGPLSEPVIITLDADPPEVTVIAPPEGAIVDEGRVTVKGRSEPGANVSIRNASGGAPYELTVGPEGTFKAQVALGPKANRISIRATDALGNTRSVERRVVRAAFEADASLRVRPSSIRIARLPTTVRIVLKVSDAKGRPVDRAPVTFSVLPFGQSAEIYEAVTRDGKATWLKRIPKDGALRGEGKVTARVTLPDGTILDERATFDFE
jgi:hypothetical protein